MVTFHAVAYMAVLPARGKLKMPKLDWDNSDLGRSIAYRGRCAFPKLAANRTFRGDGLTDQFWHVSYGF